MLPTPPPRVRSKELQARLAKLQRQLEGKQYERMTADVTVQAGPRLRASLASWPQAHIGMHSWCLQERQARDAKEGGVQSYRQQISYGVHVSVMMGTFYAAGFYGAKAVSENPVHVRPGLCVLAAL